MTLRTIADADRGSVDAVACLVVAAGVAIAANVSALWRGVRDIVNDPVRARSKASRNPPGLSKRPAVRRYYNVQNPRGRMKRDIACRFSR